MSPGATFERIYLALKEQILAGNFRPGDYLEPAALSQELNASITPVRDALHRLVGERLVETPRTDGFRVPLMTEMGLRHLHGWNQELLLLALRSRAAGGIEMPAAIAAGAAPRDLAARTGGLFLGIARRYGNPLLVAAIAANNDRLFACRLIEEQVLDGVAEELESVRLAAAEDAANLRRILQGYHRRRQRAAPRLLEALLSPPAGQPRG
jgi:DNA-binding GntR family transcriptional regulator